MYLRIPPFQLARKAEFRVHSFTASTAIYCRVCYSQRMAFPAHSDTYSQSSMCWRSTTRTASPAIFKLHKLDLQHPKPSPRQSPPLATSDTASSSKICTLSTATGRAPTRKYNVSFRHNLAHSFPSATTKVIAVPLDRQSHRRRPRARQPIKFSLLGRRPTKCAKYAHPRPTDQLPSRFVPRCTFQFSPPFAMRKGKAVTHKSRAGCSDGRQRVGWTENEVFGRTVRLWFVERCQTMLRGSATTE